MINEQIANVVERYLDVGARTLLIPYVQNAEEAKRAVTGLRYPPGGMRGVSGTTRANRYGRVKDYFKRVHDEVCLLLQVETRTALSQPRAIAEIDGVDGIFIGPNDLAADLGISATGSIRRCGKPWKTRASASARPARRPASSSARPTASAASTWDYLFVAVGSDLVMLARGADALAAKFRK